jgi:hypothetical protein
MDSVQPCHVAIENLQIIQKLPPHKTRRKWTEKLTPPQINAEKVPKEETPKISREK